MMKCLTLLASLSWVTYAAWAAPPTYRATSLASSHDFQLERAPGSNSQGLTVYNLSTPQGFRAGIRNTLTGTKTQLPAPDFPGSFITSADDVGEDGTAVGMLGYDRVLANGVQVSVECPLRWCPGLAPEYLGVPGLPENILTAKTSYIAPNGVVVGYVDVLRSDGSLFYDTVPAWWDSNNAYFDPRPYITYDGLSGPGINRFHYLNDAGEILASSGEGHSMRYWKLVPTSSTPVPEGSSMALLLSAFTVTPAVLARRRKAKVV